MIAQKVYGGERCEWVESDIYGVEMRGSFVLNTHISCQLHHSKKSLGFAFFANVSTFKILDGLDILVVG